MDYLSLSLVVLLGHIFIHSELSSGKSFEIHTLTNVDAGKVSSASLLLSAVCCQIIPLAMMGMIKVHAPCLRLSPDNKEKSWQAAVY
jgi:EamA domain-containing membrane protein RarD